MEFIKIKTCLSISKILLRERKYKAQCENIFTIYFCIFSISKIYKRPLKINNKRRQTTTYPEKKIGKRHE